MAFLTCVTAFTVFVGSSALGASDFNCVKFGLPVPRVLYHSQCLLVFGVILVLHSFPKQRTVHSELAFLIAEEEPGIYLDD